MSTTMITWESAYGDQFTTRVFTHHVLPFVQDIKDVGGTVLEIRDES